MPSPPVLLLTHSGDFFTIDRVEAALRARGARPLRVDTDLFPTQLRLTGQLSAGRRAIWLDTGAEAVRLDEVQAIWARKLWPATAPSELEPAFQEACSAESRRAFFGLFGLLDAAFWINRPDRALAAEAKLTQLAIAGELGLLTPDTLITNDPARVRDFFAQTGGAMVTKLLGALTQSMDGRSDFVYTSRVREEDLLDLEGLRFAPQLFQPLLEKARELRVIVVGERVFCGAIGRPRSDVAQVDWRRATAEDGVAWEPATLPEPVLTRVHALMKRLGLTYGAIDFIVTPEGEHCFLEVNPAGEWGWLERDLAFPISEALADALLSRGQTA